MKIKNILLLLLFFVFTILPLMLGLCYAVLQSFGIIGSFNSGFTWQHYKALFAEGALVNSVFYTIGLALISIVLATLFALIATLGLHKYFVKEPLSYLINLPLAFPSIVASFFFFQLLSSSGIVARLCIKIGIISNINKFPSLINDTYNIGIITAQLFVTTPFFILLFTSIYYNQHIAQYSIIAKTLGATKKYVALKVAAPIILQKALPTIFLYFIFKLGIYEIPLILGKSAPETLSVMAVRKMQKFNLLDIPQGYAIAVLYAVLLCFFLIVFFKLNKQQSAI